MIAVGMVLIVIGLFFLVVAAVGMVRLPDVYSRSHALSITDSLGALFLLVGLAVYQGLNMTSLRIFGVLVLIYLLNPVTAHATVRAAYRAGVKPWNGGGDKS